MSMRAPRLARANGERRPERFLVYVEGPRDRDVIQAFARRLLPPLSRALPAACVILGGRQPARAASHLAREREEGEARGVCVLDRDASEAPAPPPTPGLEFFTWRRRHIESYLLVPAAIERASRVRDARLRRLLGEELPDPSDERALAGFDAKRFLGRAGPLARFLGRTVAPGEIALAMRAQEAHVDVRSLLVLLAAGLGVELGLNYVLLQGSPPGPAGGV